MEMIMGDTYLVHDGSLLLQCHSNWVLVAISVKSYRAKGSYVSKNQLG